MEVWDGLEFLAGFVEGVEFDGLNGDVLKLGWAVAKAAHGSVEQDIVATVVMRAQDDNFVAMVLQNLMVNGKVFEELGIFPVAVLEGAIALVPKVGCFDVPVFGFVFEGGLLDVGGEVGSELSG